MCQKLREKEEIKDCTFVPVKVANLEFEYSDEFKDVGERLYNNYFEREAKLKMLKNEQNE